MGWLAMSGYDGFDGPKAYLENQFTYETTDKSSRLLRSALVGMKTWYAACEQIDKSTGDREIFAIVCLVRISPRDRDGLVFSYKDMIEHMGPCEDDCPATILDLLTPTDSEYALAWRERCRARLARRKRRMPEHGDTIVFAEEQTFVDGHVGRRFTCERNGRQVVLRSSPSGARYRVRHFSDQAWTVIPKIAASLGSPGLNPAH